MTSKLLATAVVIAVQKEFQPRLAAVERYRDITPNQRDAELFARGNEARDRLTCVLGVDGFESYKRRVGGWLGAAINRSAGRPEMDCTFFAAPHRRYLCGEPHWF